MPVISVHLDPAFGIPLPDIAKPINMECGEVARRTSLLFPKGSWDLEGPNKPKTSVSERLSLQLPYEGV